MEPTCRSDANINETVEAINQKTHKQRNATLTIFSLKRGARCGKLGYVLEATNLPRGLGLSQSRDRNGETTSGVTERFLLGVEPSLRKGRVLRPEVPGGRSIKS